MVGLQNAIKYYEETLIQLSSPREITARMDSYRYYRNQDKTARANLAKTPTGTYPYPKDDSTVSKRKTPDEAGVRPCRHCGSGKHWDNECRYSRKAQRFARANYVELTPQEEEAQEAYEEAYLDLSSEDEQEARKEEQDFGDPSSETR